MTGAFAAGVWVRLGRQHLRGISASAVALYGVWVIIGRVLIQASEYSQHHH